MSKSLVHDFGFMVGSAVLTMYARKGNRESPTYSTEIAPGKGLSLSFQIGAITTFLVMLALAFCW